MFDCDKKLVELELVGFQLLKKFDVFTNEIYDLKNKH